MLNLPYIPSDHYWFIGTDLTQVWASGRMEYVPVDDNDYAAWVGDPSHLTSVTTNTADLAQVMTEQAMPGYLAGGIQITSTGTPSINNTYGLDSVTLDQIGNVARDVASGLGFPQGASTFLYPAMDSTMVSFTEETIVNLYKAMRNYVAQATYAVQTRALGGVADLPSNVVTIG